jgi:Ca2+-binding EF-hand superfamily protein
MGNKHSKLDQQTTEFLLKNTKFSEKEIISYHRGFIKDFQKGITQTDFLQVFKNYFPFGDCSKYSSIVFKIIDIDNDDLISFKDFMQTLNICLKESFTEKIKCTFLIH